MYDVYVIECARTGKRYSGIAESAEKRLHGHNAGRCKFTKAFGPWAIIYTEIAESWSKARAREKYLKSAAGRRFIEKLVPRKTEKENHSP